MKIITKISLCFGLLVGGYGLTVGLTDLRSRQVELFLTNIEGSSVPDVNHAHAAVIGFKQTIAAFQDAVVFGEVTSLERATQQAQEVNDHLLAMGGATATDKAESVAQAAVLARALQQYVAEALPLYRRLAEGDTSGDLPQQAAAMKQRSDVLVASLVLLQDSMREQLGQQIDLRRSQNRAERTFSEVVMVVVLIAATALTGVIMLSLSRRLGRLTLASARLRAGNYDGRVTDGGRDEVGQLADGFEAMRAAVEARNQELQAFNTSLDSLVKERTRELEQRNQELSTQICERQRAERSLRLIESAVSQVDDGVLIAQAMPLHEVVPDYTNPAFRRVLGLADQEQASGVLLLSLAGGNGQRTSLERAWSLAQQGQPQSVEISNQTSDHRQLICEWTVSPIRDVDGRTTGLVVILRDLTERKHQDSQRQQGQKMESVGQLAAGVAHEINTPIQFIGDNLRFLGDAFGDLGAVLSAYAAVLAAGRNLDLPAALIAATDAAIKRADMAYLAAEIPKAIGQSLDGVTRVAEIVRAMKEFSHPDQGEKKPTDLNKAIQTTLTVARNEYKYVADLVTELAPDLPAVPCIVGEFNQVVLNLVINAAHAISDVVAKHGGKGTITVSTQREGERVLIRITDTGTGIPESVRAKIFDPFFTTKEVGKGTGQGLYIAHTVVVKKHGGSLSFVTESGKGTTFIIALPVAVAVG